MIRSHRLAAVALAAALVVSACGGSDDTESSSATTAPGKVDTSSDITGKGPDGSGPAPDAVAVAVRIDVDSFDPHTSLGDSAAQQAFLFLYDTMVHRTHDAEILPVVAFIAMTRGSSLACCSTTRWTSSLPRFRSPATKKCAGVSSWLSSCVPAWA